jgi:hypothetical protein
MGENGMRTGFLWEITRKDASRMNTFSTVRRAGTGRRWKRGLRRIKAFICVVRENQKKRQDASYSQ